MHMAVILRSSDNRIFQGHVCECDFVLSGKKKFQFETGDCSLNCPVSSYLLS